MFMKSWVRTLLIWAGLILFWTVGTIGTSYGEPHLATIEGVDYIVQDPVVSYELVSSLYVIAIAFIMTGCFIWTRLKNRHWAFLLWGLLAPIGLLGISLLKDKSAAKQVERDGLSI